MVSDLCDEKDLKMLKFTLKNMVFDWWQQAHD